MEGTVSTIIIYTYTYVLPWGLYRIRNFLGVKQDIQNKIVFVNKGLFNDNPTFLCKSFCWMVTTRSFELYTWRSFGNTWLGVRTLCWPKSTLNIGMPLAKNIGISQGFSYPNVLKFNCCVFLGSVWLVGESLICYQYFIFKILIGSFSTSYENKSLVES